MTKLQLRPYQHDTVAAVFSSWQAGYKAPLIVKPTGSGKTVVQAEVARRLLPKRTLVFAMRALLGIRRRKHSPLQARQRG